jgi:hypothetical protein
MRKPFLSAECPNPWIYWWKQLMYGQRFDLSLKHFGKPPEGFGEQLSNAELEFIWRQEKLSPLQEYDWIELADRTFRDPNLFDEEQTKEIWRQVYRIAGERI